MEFCEKCGRLIILAEGKAVCAGCGYKPKRKVKIEASEKVEKHSAIAVINEKEETTYPLTDMECPKCKNKKSYFWTTQTRSSDESETKFYKCAKCNHTWRKYR